jgi:hypothetical protein
MHPMLVHLVVPNAPMDFECQQPHYFAVINERKMKKITLNLTLTLLFSLFATQINATTHNHGEQQNMEAVGIQNPWVTQVAYIH